MFVKVLLFQKKKRYVDFKFAMCKKISEVVKKTLVPLFQFDTFEFPLTMSHKFWKKSNLQTFQLKVI